MQDPGEHCTCDQWLGGAMPGFCRQVLQLSDHACLQTDCLKAAGLVNELQGCSSLSSQLIHNYRPSTTVDGSCQFTGNWMKQLCGWRPAWTHCIWIATVGAGRRSPSWCHTMEEELGELAAGAEWSMFHPKKWLEHATCYKRWTYTFNWGFKASSYYKLAVSPQNS